MAGGYDEGDKIRISASFVNISNAPADPTTVTVKYEKPGPPPVVTTKIYGTDVEVVKDSTGVYHIDISLDQSGSWRYRWIGTGDVEAAAQSTFSVTAKFF